MSNDYENNNLYDNIEEYEAGLKLIQRSGITDGYECIIYIEKTI